MMSENRDQYKFEYLTAIEKMLETLYGKLEAINSKIKTQEVQPQLKYYRNEDLKKIFGLSNNTIIKYRITGTLPYTKLGDIFLYEASKIEKILKNNEP